MKAHRSFYKEWENQDYEDEYYDRSKKNKFNKNSVTVTKADIKEGDTYESVKARLNGKMDLRDTLMQKLIDINYETSQKAKKEDYDELDEFMEQNTKQLKKDEKEFVANKLKETNLEIERLNEMLSMLMPSSFSTAQKLEVKPATTSDKKQKPKEKKPVKKREEKAKGGLSDVFQKLSAMAEKKEKELKKTQQETDSEQQKSIQDTPRFALSEAESEPITIKDVAPGKEEEKDYQDEEMPPEKSFFSEIVSNIKPVGEDDSIDTSKYSNFMKEYNDYHNSKSYNKNKRQKTEEGDEVIRFGDQ